MQSCYVIQLTLGCEGQKESRGKYLIKIWPKRPLSGYINISTVLSMNDSIKPLLNYDAIFGSRLFLADLYLDLW